MGSLFNNLLTLAVFLNTAVLAMDGSFDDEQVMLMMDELNTGFTFTFIVELAMKLIALGPKGYVADTMNIFDGVQCFSYFLQASKNNFHKKTL